MCDLFAPSILLAVAQAAATAGSTHGGARRPIVRTSMLSGSAYVTELLNGHPRRFEEVFHMPKETFIALRDFFLQRNLLEPTKRGFSVEEQIAIFLFIVCGPNSNRQAQERFQHSGETITRHFHAVLDALVIAHTELVRPPPDNIPQRITSDPRKMRPYFDNVRGAIDGTHIPAKVSSALAPSFRDRSGNLSQNVLAACSLDLYFTYVCPGWEGSAHDARVLENALLNDFPVMKGRIYLADAGYGLRDGFLTPYHGVRYHLREQARYSQRPSTPAELFNLRHATLRNAIERIFGVLKKRFPILKKTPEYEYRHQVQLVLALTALHNFIRRHAQGREDRFYREADVERDRELAQGGGGELGGGRTQQEAVGDDTHMAEYRDKLAQQMWEDYIRFTNRR